MGEPIAGEITRLLAEAALGNKEGLDRLLPLVYEELRAWPGTNSGPSESATR